jgi:hypothetical protein
VENKKYYTNSSGEQVDISTLETTHLINAIGKKQRDIFNSKDKDAVSKELEEIKNLREEYHKRFNEWYDKLEG